MVKILERYFCEKCGTEYYSRVIAEMCEASIVPDEPKHLLGATVSFEVDHSTYEDVVGKLVLRPLVLGALCQEVGTNNERLTYLRSLSDCGTHVWRVKMANDSYDFDGEPIELFSIEYLTIVRPTP